MSLRIYGNRSLKTLPGRDTRPTPARVREALFNIWQGAIVGCRWLDLCAGSGAMGAEALCRGAKLVVGMEQSPRACAIVQQNWQMLAGADQTFQLIRGDVVRRIKTLSGQQFDRIYFDPPYDSGLYTPVMEAIVQLHLLAPDGELAVEHDPQRSVLTGLPTLELSGQKVYGGSAIAFYRKLADRNLTDTPV